MCRYGAVGSKIFNMSAEAVSKLDRDAVDDRIEEWLMVPIRSAVVVAKEIDHSNANPRERISANLYNMERLAPDYSTG